MPEPSHELHDLIRKYQSGDLAAGWQFAEHQRIKYLVKKRLGDYKRMFFWLPQEVLEDVEAALIPRTVELIGKFQLPEQKNDGRIYSYFSLRLKGEADYLLKTIANMKQLVDNETGKQYMMLLDESLEGAEESEKFQARGEFEKDLIETIEGSRQNDLIEELFDCAEGNDKLWVSCYLNRLRKKTWAEIAKEVGQKTADHTWLKENTSRFVTRLKQKLLQMGERISYRACGIYTDCSEVAIALYDSSDRKRNLVWSKTYDNVFDIEKIEAKIGDIFRQAEVNYVMMNDPNYENAAYLYLMRFFARKESYVETVDLSPFVKLLPSMPSGVNGIPTSDTHKMAWLLLMIKRAWNEERRISSLNDKRKPDSDSISPLQNR